ncbi:MAG: hypothetical protein NC117_09100 [Pseudoflavonifractor sp.]|nr:hypothetical protein [Pseudoflavonifractor sp.]
MSRRHHNLLTQIATMLPLWAIAMAFSFSVTECDGNRNDVAVPRPSAYPRVVTYDTVYVAVDSLPVMFEVNSSTTVTRGDEAEPNAINKINVIYPRYGATLYCTYTPVTPATAPAVIDNRVERMSLNAGSLSTEISRMSNRHGIGSAILVTPAAKVTPVQFLSTDSASFVLTGALFTGTGPADTDSMRPVLDAVVSDLVHSLGRIHPLTKP